MAIIPASFSGHVEIVRLLLSDNRVRADVNDQLSLKLACTGGHIEVVKCLLTNDSVQVTKAALLDIDNKLPPRHDTGDPALVAQCMQIILATQPELWPNVINEKTKCMRGGLLRQSLTRLGVRLSWVLLLCVKRRCSPHVAARMGDVLRDVCTEWIPIQTLDLVKKKAR
jgi:hypothetical protein